VRLQIINYDALQARVKYWLGDAGEVALLYREVGWAIMMARLLIIAACFIWVASLLLLPSSFAQTYQAPVRNNDAAIAQALTQQQVANNVNDINSLRRDFAEMNVKVGSLREDLSTVKGIGMGAAAVIGLLQTLQMILQVRAVKKT